MMFLNWEWPAKGASNKRGMNDFGGLIGPRFRKIYSQNAGRASSSRPPSRTGAIRAARPVASSVSTATAQSVAGPSAGSNLPHEAVQRLALVHANDGIIVAGHSHIGDERGAAGQHAVVRGLHMRVGTDDETGASVAEMAHRLLLARRLAVDVDHDCVRSGLQRAGGELALSERERIVERVHKDAAHQVDREHARAARGLEQHHAAPRRAGRIVVRTDEPRRALDEDERLALIPRMIAAGDDIGAGVDHLRVDLLGDAETASRVLAVDDNAIELPVALERRQALDHGRTARTPHHIADEQDTHSASAQIDHLALR
jgi:hypothetical protein